MLSTAANKKYAPVIILLSILLLVSLLPACSSSSNSPEEPNELEPIGWLSLSGLLSDVTGYVDPATNKEYAIVGYLSLGKGVSIVDVSDPANPVAVAGIDSIPGFDVKVWGNYLYTVNGGSNGLGSIVDISNPASPVVVGQFPSAHNIFISDNGYLFASVSGLKIYNLNPNPISPQLVWQNGDGGHDAAVIGTRLFDFHGFGGSVGAGYTNIFDIVNPEAPQFLGRITDPAIAYHHSGWTSEDGNYLFINDELSNHPSDDITVWDISDLGNPTKVGGYNDSLATVHNLYVIGDYAYVAYYASGFRIFDISDPLNMQVVAEYDTSPQYSGQGFHGAFGVYPFAPSGNIYLSDGEMGLYIFRFDRL